MKATDLMIGDWVLHFGEEARIVGIRIDNYNNSPYFKTNLHDTWYESGVDGIEPIPLTPEILEKNRFRLVAVGDNGPGTPKKNLNRYEKWECKTQFQTFHVFHDRIRDTYSLNAFSNHIEGITFVHKLQHALKPCKIDKEIVL